MATVGAFAAIFDDAGRILCVRRNYGMYDWTLPGGLVEWGESPAEAARREVLEETGYRIEVGDIIGLYYNSRRDDLVICFGAKIVGGSGGCDPWEIADIGFFGREELPNPLSPRAAVRIADAFDGLSGVVRVLEGR